MKERKKGYDNRKHDKDTRIHSLNPKIVSIEDCLMSTGEANLFDCYDGRLLRQPDNLYFLKNHVLIADEYKLRDRQYNKAIRQLQDYKHYLSQIFPNWEVVTRYVHNGNVIEKID